MAPAAGTAHASSTNTTTTTASATSDSGVPTDSDTPVSSLLSRLGRPTALDLACKRNLQTNPPKGLKHGNGVVSAEPSVSPLDKDQRIPDEHLSATLGKLFCNACRENLSVKKSISLKRYDIKWDPL